MVASISAEGRGKLRAALSRGSIPDGNADYAAIEEHTRPMRVYYSPNGEVSLGPAALTIGAFDGMHRGHQRLVARTWELAREQNLRAVAVTFWPHPLAVIQPETAPSLLSTLDERLATLTASGHLDATVVIPFTPELAAESAEAFLDRISAFCAPRVLVEGPDFAMGHQRQGDLAFLRAEGARRGFAVESLEVAEDGQRISSSRIRDALRAGQVETATRLLGRPYMLSGEVVLGDQRGRLLGFPTANLRGDARITLPANGVYAVRARLPGEATATHAGVCNIGVRPTFGGEPKLLVEAHLLDMTMDLYGLTIAVEFVARLRDERRFAGVAELTAQIAADAHQARERLARAQTRGEDEDRRDP